MVVAAILILAQTSSVRLLRVESSALSKSPSAPLWMDEQVKVHLKSPRTSPLPGGGEGVDVSLPAHLSITGFRRSLPERRRFDQGLAQNENGCTLTSHVTLATSNNSIPLPYQPAGRVPQWVVRERHGRSHGSIAGPYAGFARGLSDAGRIEGIDGRCDAAPLQLFIE